MKRLEVGHLGGLGENAIEYFDTVTSLLGGSLQQIEELIVFAQHLLEGKHNKTTCNLTVTMDARRILRGSRFLDAVQVVLREYSAD